MSLPQIQPYPLPSGSDIPDGRVRWRPDPARAALLIHDMQHYFLAPYRGEEDPVRGMVDNIARLAETCRSRGMPVFYTAQPGQQSSAQRGLLTEFWGEGIGAVLDADPRAEDILERLAPRDGDVRLTKWRYSAFQRSAFAQQLTERGRDQLLITGIYAHIGCQTTAVEAFMRDVGPFFVADAVADFTRRHHDQALEYVAQRCGMVTTTAEVCATLAAPTSGAARATG